MYCHICFKSITFVSNPSHLFQIHVTCIVKFDYLPKSGPSVVDVIIFLPVVTAWVTAGPKTRKKEILLIICTFHNTSFVSKGQSTCLCPGGGTDQKHIAMNYCISAGKFLIHISGSQLFPLSTDPWLHWPM